MPNSSIHWDPNYSTYYINLANLLVLGIIPVSLLAYYNGAMYKNIKSQSILFEDQQCLSRSRKKEHHLARVLFGMVVIFIACHALRIFIHSHDMFTIWDIIKCQSNGLPWFSLWEILSIEVNELMLVVNSSVNTIIYCCLNKTFRKDVSRFRERLRKVVAITNIGEHATHVSTQLIVISKG